MGQNLEKSSGFWMKCLQNESRLSQRNQMKKKIIIKRNKNSENIHTGFLKCSSVTIRILFFLLQSGLFVKVASPNSFILDDMIAVKNSDRGSITIKPESLTFYHVQNVIKNVEHTFLFTLFIYICISVALKEFLKHCTVPM